MSSQRRSRPKLLLLLSVASAFHSIAAQGLGNNQQANRFLHSPFENNNNFRTSKQQQYQPAFRFPNNLLVNSASSSSNLLPQFAQSLPLTRLQSSQVQQNQADLENVIESTTSNSIHTHLMLTNSQHQLSSTKQPAPVSCQLPPTWAGKWYQSNKEPIRVTNTEISDKGLCRDQKGDKFLFEYNGTNKQQQQQQSSTSAPCLVCLVINERHLNVLQYKESSCQPIPANYFNQSSNNLILDDDHSLLDNICSDITGDAQLESIFRLETPAIECPINGQFTFTYDNCREPHSLLDSCIDKKHLNFKFSACPDVPGSESKSEVLKCYADWSEGNNYYMIGRLENASNNQDKGKFRCFVYEKSSDGKIIQMAQSLEESCYGLINANEGPKTLRLTVKPPTTNKCYFPAYIQALSENWLSVDNSLIYTFNQDSTKYTVKETKEGNIIEEATCLQQFSYPQAYTHPHHLHLNHQIRSSSSSSSSSSNQAQQPVMTNRRQTSTSINNQADQSSKSTTNDLIYLVQIIKGCHTLNYCVRFYRRSNGIVQIDYFFNAQNNDNQCRNAFIGTPQTQIITSTNQEYQRCPFEGVYTIEAPIESDLTYNPSNIFICPRQSFLTASCDHPSRLRIHSKCGLTKHSIKNLYCLGSWTTNGLVRLLLIDDLRQKYSAWYRDYGAFIPQDGVLSSDTPHIQLTRSQQLLASSNSQHMVNLMTPPIIDFQIALITPPTFVASTMQVRLTRKNHCSDLKGYASQGAFGGPISAIQSNNLLPSYAPSATASSGVTFIQMTLLEYSLSSILILIVTLLIPLFRRDGSISLAL